MSFVTGSRLRIVSVPQIARCAMMIIFVATLISFKNPHSILMMSLFVGSTVVSTCRVSMLLSPFAQTLIRGTSNKYSKIQIIEIVETKEACDESIQLRLTRLEGRKISHQDYDI
jgi:hypothetical protein